MKKWILSLLTMFIAVTVARGQSQKAQSVEKADQKNTFYVESKITRTCGSYSDFSYAVTNNSNTAFDIKFFVEGTDHKWRSLGYVNKLEGGAKVSPINFLSCANTGNWVIYYRVAGAKDEFPLTDEVQRKYGN